jgi:hypothetical protein
MICGDSQLFDEVHFATNTTYPELLYLHEEDLTDNEDGCSYYNKLYHIIYICK